MALIIIREVNAVRANPIPVAMFGCRARDGYGGTQNSYRTRREIVPKNIYRQYSIRRIENMLKADAQTEPHLALKALSKP